MDLGIRDNLIPGLSPMEDNMLNMTLWTRDTAISMALLASAVGLEPLRVIKILRNHGFAFCESAEILKEALKGLEPPEEIDLQK